MILDDWFQTTQGRAIAHACAQQVNMSRDILRGDILLQLGSCGDNVWLSDLKYRHQWMIDSCVQKSTACVARAHQLPFERHSVDCIVAPFTMNICAQPCPLDEWDRVLKPMGYMIFFNVQPLSLWGVALKSSALPFVKHDKAHEIFSWSLHRMLRSRGYQQLMLNYFYFIPPCIPQKWLYHLEFLNEMGKMFPLFPAGFYCLIVQKYQEDVLSTVPDGFVLC